MILREFMLALSAKQSDPARAELAGQYQSRKTSSGSSKPALASPRNGAGSSPEERLGRQVGPSFAQVESCEGSPREVRLMRRCGLCLVETVVLAKSHIIPQALTMGMVPKGVPLVVVPIKPSDRPAPISRRPGGVWDRIVCLKCEHKHFGPADDTFLRFHRAVLSDRSPWNLLRIDGAVSHRYREHEVAGALIHRFVVQTVLRAALSKHEDWKGFELSTGEIEDLRQICLRDADVMPEGFGVATIITRSRESNIVLGPVRSDGDFPTVRFWVPHMAFYMALSDAGLPPVFRHFQMQMGSVPAYHPRRFDPPERVWLDEMERNHGAAMTSFYNKFRLKDDGGKDV